MNLDAELVEEIADSLEITGIRLTSSQILQLLDGEDELVEQIEEWGADDTDLLGQLANLLARDLVGEGWPTFGDERNGCDTEDFAERLFVAARIKGFAVIGD
jgi:hypothetical protein